MATTGKLLGILAAGVLGATPARADPPPATPAPSSPVVPEPEPYLDDKVDFMHIFGHRGLHDTRDETVNAYGQITLIGDGKPSFSARYTNLGAGTNSLLTSAEGSWTGTTTLFLGGRLWHGAEAYVVPEVISERPLSHLLGLGSTIQNAELQKTGGAAPTLYLSRAYLRQTFGFGGDPVQKKSDAMQLGGAVDSRRLVITAGKLSVLDFLDKSSLAGDLRRQFMNMAFLTNAAYDFAADARGYTWGALAELYFDAWAARLMRAAGPQDPNQLSIDYRVWEHYGDQLEIEHGHKLLGQTGVVRVLGYRNQENMGRFADAIAAFESDPRKNGATCPQTSFSYRANAAVPPTAAQTAAATTAPDLCWVRRDNVKMGVGINVEQQLSDDLGVFLRGMYSDGQTEVFSFTSTDRSLSFGVLSRGSLWHRATDSAGAAFGLGWISGVHAAYLNMGGIDGFVGDGKITQAAESVLEVFYSLNVAPSLWLTADYQHITNPGYNADRGPVEIFGGRLHSEF